MFSCKEEKKRSCAWCPTLGGFIANKGHENEQLRSEVGVRSIRWCEHCLIFMHTFTRTNSFPEVQHNIHVIQDRLRNVLASVHTIGSSIDIFHANPSLLQGGSFYDAFLESKFSCFSRQGGLSTKGANLSSLPCFLK